MTVETEKRTATEEETEEMDPAAAAELSTAFDEDEDGAAPPAAADSEGETQADDAAEPPPGEPPGDKPPAGKTPPAPAPGEKNQPQAVEHRAPVPAPLVLSEPGADYKPDLDRLRHMVDSVSETLGETEFDYAAVEDGSGKITMAQLQKEDGYGLLLQASGLQNAALIEQQVMPLRSAIEQLVQRDEAAVEAALSEELIERYGHGDLGNIDADDYWNFVQTAPRWLQAAAVSKHADGVDMALRAYKEAKGMSLPEAGAAAPSRRDAVASQQQAALARKKRLHGSSLRNRAAAPPPSAEDPNSPKALKEAWDEDEDED